VAFDFGIEGRIGINFGSYISVLKMLIVFLLQLQKESCCAPFVNWHTFFRQYVNFGHLIMMKSAKSSTRSLKKDVKWVLEKCFIYALDENKQSTAIVKPIQTRCCIDKVEFDLLDF
jgi:hypothetical protein